MAEYKCISCGAIRDSEKEINCPDCGYSMYLMPYERHDKLCSEIKRFFANLRIDKISIDDLTFYREVKSKHIFLKDDKDQRFPSLDKIHKYVSSCQKTKDFCERMAQTIEQIKKYLHETYEQSYTVDYGSIISRTQKYDETLVKACKLLEINYDPAEMIMPHGTVKYTEQPDNELIHPADDILNVAAELLEKYKKFIRINNLYVDAHREDYKRSIKKKESMSDTDVLRTCMTQATSVRDKDYVLDFMDDGVKETKEILSAMWMCINTILESRVLMPIYEFSFDNSDSADGSDFDNVLLRTIAPRYKIIDDAINSDMLESKSEDELFDIYKEFVVLDPFGVFKSNKDQLTIFGEGEKKLQKLIGLAPVKSSIDKIKAYALANKNSNDLNLHMCFYGNPGTGKTEVARIIAQILYENKILPSKKVVEVDREGLISQYVGETPIKTKKKIEEAMGGVLFVDEAYAIIPKDGSGFDFGHEAVATLIKAMEDYRGKFCVILAGYRNEMHKMIESNPGFKSRIQFELDFPNYSRDELGEITRLMLDSKQYSAEAPVIERMLDITDIERKEPNFANARSVRNILDQVIMCQNLRCMGENKELGIVDVNKYIEDNNIILPTSGSGKEQTLLTGEDELDQLIGLDQVKRVVKKIRAYAKKNMDDPNFNMHMCFYGNPGTGKTEVARIISRILYDSGVLKEAKIVETDAHGLIGKYVGETAPKTLDKINEAMDGVLFIDEAYSLIAGNTINGGSYGEEAIAVLLKEMEDKRGHFCVILAGYRKEMKEMISSNPGLESRIQFTLEFPDYSSDELSEIAKQFAVKKGYFIAEDALSRIVEVTEYYRNRPNFANARTVRNVLDQVIMNQNLRTEEEDGNYEIILQDVEDYLTDEGLDLDNPDNGKKKFGFV